MHVVVLARNRPLAAAVKDWCDSRHLGLTEIVPVREDVAAAEREIEGLMPSILVLVGSRGDGLMMAACEHFGRCALVQRVPFMIAVEDASEAERIAMLDAGADAVVQPFNLEVIERRVKTLVLGLRPTAVGRPEPVADMRGSSVMASERVARLTAREAAVLRMLVARRDAVVSRVQLEQEIWGMTNSRTLDVHVARLRRKLGSLGTCIETVPKVGYRYREPI